MKTLISIIALVLLTVISSCQNGEHSSNNGNAVGQINLTISVDDFEKKLNETVDVQLIDVRTPEEFAEGHLKGAININVNSDDFDKKINQLDKTKTVMVYCLSGGRSSTALEILEEKGFKEAYNMQGGIMKWTASNKELADANTTNMAKGMSLGEFNKLLDTDKYVLVDYNAKWCKPCIKMAPMFEALAQSKKDKLVLAKVDADENKELLKEKGIESLPVLELYKDGKLIWKHKGEIDEATLLKETKL